MLPEAKLIRNEIVIRNMNLSQEVKLTKQALIRWIALALGLINPRESRDALLTILEILIGAHFKGEKLTVKDILARLPEGKKIDEKTIYYHLQRLAKIGLLNREKGEYFFGDGVEKDLYTIIKRAYDEKYNEAFEKIKEALESLKVRS